MPKHNSYFPPQKGDQIPMLRNFRIKLAARFAELGYTSPDISSVLADCDWAIYLLETFIAATRQFAQGATVHVRNNLYSTTGGSALPLPGFSLPISPAPPITVGPGALRRVFAFIKAMKTRPLYTNAIGEDLGVIGAEVTEDPDASPVVKKPFVRGNEVIVPFVLDGHMAVWVECSIDGGPFVFIVIDTNSPYNDARPLAPGKTAEKRRYRLCFWDGTPTNVWTTTEEVAFGG